MHPTQSGVGFRGGEDAHLECLGRSGFFVFMKLPEGHKATIDYFQSL